jgi:hypothetical protein
MRSRMLWVVASAAAVLVLTACSSDDDADPAATGLPNQPGAGGSSGASTAASAGTGGTGGTSSETSTAPPLANGSNGEAAGSNDADAGAADAGRNEPAPGDAGGTPPVRDAGGNPPGNPPPGGDAVGFSDVFQLLLDNCGNCHGANAPGNRPRFAQAANQAASFTATQATSPNGGPVSARIIARAVTTRDMPPACGRAALGTGACLDAAEAALLQAWVTQGGRP